MSQHYRPPLVLCEAVKGLCKGLFPPLLIVQLCNSFYRRRSIGIFYDIRQGEALAALAVRQWSIQ